MVPAFIVTVVPAPLMLSPPAAIVSVGLGPLIVTAPPPWIVAPSNVLVDDTAPRMFNVPDAATLKTPVCVLLRTLRSTVPLWTSSSPLLLKSGLNAPPPSNNVPAPADLRNVPRLVNVP